LLITARRVTESEYFAGAAACLVQNGEEEPDPQPGAGTQDRLHLGSSQDPRLRSASSMARLDSIAWRMEASGR
jgi:hypothetical protein